MGVGVGVGVVEGVRVGVGVGVRVGVLVVVAVAVGDGVVVAVAVVLAGREAVAVEVVVFAAISATAVPLAAGVTGTGRTRRSQMRPAISGRPIRPNNAPHLARLITERMYRLAIDVSRGMCVRSGRFQSHALPFRIAVSERNGFR
jgi:hypothetical protein